MKTKTTLLGLLLFGACAWHASAQATFDSSGNGQLNGNYYMRQVFYFVSDTAGDLGEAINIQGEIAFNGAGGYTFNGTLLDSATNSSTPATVTNKTGTYVISASGEGYISAIDSNFPNDQIIGLVSSKGVFIGSSTENGNGYSDLFIAAPIGSVANNATLNGTYQVAYFDPTFAPTTTSIPGGDALFTMTANGSGTIGNVSVTGYLGTNSTVSTQSLTGVTYSFTNGAAQLNFGGSSSSLIYGTEVLYTTPDGNFIFGGSANGFDMFAGVKAATSNPTNYDGLYYQAGLDLNNAAVSSSGSSLFDSYYGSFQAFTQNIIGDQRTNSALLYNGSSDFTYYDTYTLNGNGTSTDTAFLQSYVSSTDGTIRIGYGLGPYLGLNIAFQAPAFNGSGVYLSPVGVVNAASSAPFTAFLSPGEFLTLYGSGLSATTSQASVPFPTTAGLSGVTVTINEIPAPIYYVSPTQISVIVPYDVSPGSVAAIQVHNNGANSNTVTQFTGLTSAGIFTNTPEGGTGIAAALRPDYSVVSEANPAHVGEAISLYVAGMGAVTPAVGDGTAASSTTLSNTNSSNYVYLYDSAGNAQQITPLFSGLAPGFAGLYQINFTVPTGLVTGDADIELQGPDSDTLEAYMPLSSTAAAAVPAERASGATRPAVHAVHRHALPADKVHLAARARAQSSSSVLRGR
jgi:uncharacterized protein (TIGR03437 family)